MNSQNTQTLPKSRPYQRNAIRELSQFVKSMIRV